MFILSNNAEQNAKMIPHEFRGYCCNMVNMYLTGLEACDSCFTRQQAEWMLSTLEYMGFTVDVGMWELAESLGEGSESPIWGEVEARRSQENFVNRVKFAWAKGTELHMDEYPEHVLKPFEHLRPERSDGKVELRSADSLLEVLMKSLK